MNYVPKLSGYLRATWEGTAFNIIAGKGFILINFELINTIFNYQTSSFISTCIIKIL